MGHPVHSNMSCNPHVIIIIDNNYNVISLDNVMWNNYKKNQLEVGNSIVLKTLQLLVMQLLSLFKFSGKQCIILSR